MKKFTLNKRHIIIIAAYVFLTAIFFAAGYGVGMRTGGGLISEPIPAQAVAETDGGNTCSYHVILENDEIKLYSDSGIDTKLISSEKISTASFPKQDIELLKNGITVPTLDDAAELLENFLS